MVEDRSNLVTGIWKFSDRVPFAALKELAEEWATDPNYINLYIRKVSKDQDGIGFSYIYDGTSEAYDSWFNEQTDKLKRLHGNDLVGWDISRRTFTVKGF